MGILENEDVLIVEGEAVSQVGETDEMAESVKAFSINVPKSDSEKKVTDMNEFRGGWNKCRGEWDSGNKNL